MLVFLLVLQPYLPEKLLFCRLNYEAKLFGYYVKEIQHVEINHTFTLLSISWVSCSRILLNFSAGTSLKSDDTIWNSSLAARFLSCNDSIDIYKKISVPPFKSKKPTDKRSMMICYLPLRFLTLGLVSNVEFVEVTQTFWYFYF